jgi:hypothetical protein
MVAFCRQMMRAEQLTQRSDWLVVGPEGGSSGWLRDAIADRPIYSDACALFEHQ